MYYLKVYYIYNLVYLSNYFNYILIVFILTLELGSY